MKNAVLSKKMVISLAACGVLLLAPLGVSAEDAAQQQEGAGGHMEMRGMMGQQKGRAGDMHKMHEQMEQMHQEMSQELQKQMTALREHAKAMEGISDEKQLVEALKKHQQMTDAFLGTMLEQHEKMHARMQKHHKQMHGQMGKDQPAEGSGTEQ